MSTMSAPWRWSLVGVCLVLLAAALAVVATGGADPPVDMTALAATAPLIGGPPVAGGAVGVGADGAGGPGAAGPTGASAGAASTGGGVAGVPAAAAGASTPVAAAGARAAAAGASAPVAAATSGKAPSPYSGATPIGPVALTGCPPTTPIPPPTAPDHPTVLVAESQLPTPPAPAPRVRNLSVISGKGMWIWQYHLTSGGNVNAIVSEATAVGLAQVWVRVGDSFDGFYGAQFLDTLVPALHRVGVAVIGWGFPYLYDPVGDADWTEQALAWRGPGGARLDGWSADIETASEGTALDAKRSSTYLGLVRPYLVGRPLVATVYPPTAYWLAHYPYQAMAPYIDAFAPMLYWSCTEPGAEATMALQALGGMAPLHLIGQAYDMASVGGRTGSPSGAEIARFLDVARRGGAVGASFWVWQHMTGPEWAALNGYRWAA